MSAVKVSTLWYVCRGWIVRGVALFAIRIAEHVKDQLVNVTVLSLVLNQ